MSTRYRTLLGAALLAAGFGAFGCAGGQTGDEGESGGVCDEKRTALALDEVSALGFSAQDLLAYVEGSHTASFEWQPAMSVPYGPEQGSAELRLDVQSLGRARFVERTWPSDRPMTLEAGDCCPESVQVDVRVTLRTAGGALDETFDAVVDATRPDTATFLRMLKPPFGGSIWFDPDALGTAHVEDIQVDLRFEPGALSGQLHGRFEDRPMGNGLDGTVSLTIQSLAEWGPNSAPPLCGE